MKEIENEYKQEQEREVEVPMMTGYLDWSGVTEEEATVYYSRKKEI